MPAFFRTNLSGESAYQSFVPNPLPPNPPIEISDDILELLVKANSRLAVLESIAVRIPNVELFVSMYVRKEALMSSQIEGTQATLEDVLDPLVEANTNRNVADVVNYIKATEFAIQRLKSSASLQLPDPGNACGFDGWCSWSRKEPRRISIFAKLDWRSRKYTEKRKICSTLSG